MPRDKHFRQREQLKQRSGKFKDRQGGQCSWSGGGGGGAAESCKGQWEGQKVEGPGGPPGMLGGHLECSCGSGSELSLPPSGLEVQEPEKRPLTPSLSQ